MSTGPGRVRPARLTDLAALGELSRWSHGMGDDHQRAVRFVRNHASGFSA